MNRGITGAHPFVKWAGGKTQLLNEIERILPSALCERSEFTYVEPFVGGGAVLFWILQKYPNIKHAIINDINSELICTYKMIRDNVEELIASLQTIQNEYLALEHEERTLLFLQKRALYNSRNISQLDTATLFIFLNRTCFNGLYRVNAKGEFNVPHGKYKNPLICDTNNLRAASLLLQRVEILQGDFIQTQQYAAPNTIYYIDPPYKPISANSSFTAYTLEGFDDAQQLRLRDFCNEISNRGAIFVESNSDPKSIDSNNDFFDRIYENFSIKRVLATRMINSNPTGRGKLNEIIITNNTSL